MDDALVAAQAGAERLRYCREAAGHTCFDEDDLVEEAVLRIAFFLLKLRQLVDQGRAARAGRENRGGGDGLEVCRH